MRFNLSYHQSTLSQLISLPYQNSIKNLNFMPLIKHHKNIRQTLLLFFNYDSHFYFHSFNFFIHHHHLHLQAIVSQTQREMRKAQSAQLQRENKKNISNAKSINGISIIIINIIIEAIVCHKIDTSKSWMNMKKNSRE